jgi:hypothetical protein
VAAAHEVGRGHRPRGRRGRAAAAEEAVVVRKRKGMRRNAAGHEEDEGHRRRSCGDGGPRWRKMEATH